MTEDKIKYMVDRFLSWRLPKPWNPDNGISYQRPNYAHAPAEHDWPTGTNLFDDDQATAMVRHMIDGLPASAATEADLLHTPEYARLCGIATAAHALASVYPERCTAPPTLNHPANCHCGQVILDRALSVPTALTTAKGE